MDCASYDISFLIGLKMQHSKQSSHVMSHMIMFSPASLAPWSDILIPFFHLISCSAFYSLLYNPCPTSSPFCFLSCVTCLNCTASCPTCCCAICALPSVPCATHWGWLYYLCYRLATPELKHVGSRHVRESIMVRLKRQVKGKNRETSSTMMCHRRLRSNSEGSLYLNFILTIFQCHCSQIVLMTSKYDWSP